MAHSPVPYMDRSRRYYEVQGFDKPYVWAHFEEVPFTPLAKPLADSTLALLTTASLYGDGAQGSPTGAGSMVQADGW